MASLSYRCIGKDKDKSGCPQRQEHTNTRWECTFRTQNYEEFTRHCKNIVKRSNWRDLVSAVQKDQSGFYQCVYYSSDRKHVENHFKSSNNPSPNANTNTDIHNSSGSNSSMMSISSSEDSQASSPLPQTDMLLSPTANNSPASSNPSTPINSFKPYPSTPQRVTRTASHPSVHSKPKPLQKRPSFTNIHENNNTKNNNILTSPNSPKKKRSDDDSPDITNCVQYLPQELSKRVKTEYFLSHAKNHAFSDPENTPPNLLDDEYSASVTPRTSSPIPMNVHANSPPQTPFFTDSTKIEELLEYIQKKLLLADNQYNEIVQKLHKEGFMIVSTLKQLTDELWSRLSLPLAVEIELKRELGHQSKAVVSQWYPAHPWSPIQPQSPILTPTSGNAWAFPQYANMCPPQFSSQASFDEYDECEVSRSAESNALGSDDDLSHASHVQEEREMADILPPVETPLTHVPMRSTHNHSRDSNLFNSGTLQSHDRHE